MPSFSSFPELVRSTPEDQISVTLSLKIVVGFLGLQEVLASWSEQETGIYSRETVWVWLL